MRGSVFLAVLGLPLGGCSLLLDWSDYTGGLTTGAVTVDAPDGMGDGAAGTVPDASRTVDAAAVDAWALDASVAVDAQDAGPSDEEDAMMVVTPPVVCDLATCPTNSCDITVYFHACCIPDGGGCGCQSTIPQPGPCTAP